MTSCFRGALIALAALVLGCEAPSVPLDSGPGDAALALCTSDVACDDGLFCNGSERCDPGAPGGDARGCVASASPCIMGQSCLEGADRCETMCAVVRDADGDGRDASECGGDDCDDSDRNRFPGNGEICDPAHDEDCDPTTLGTRDADGDGHVSIECCNPTLDGATRCGGDCNDSVASVYPGAPDLCDGLDGDCDGVLDGPGEDDDADGHADDACAGRGGTDCDDEDPTVYLGAPEICDGKDNDCVERGVDGEDVDDDGHVPPGAACTGGPFPADDCDDAVASAHGGATEICNGTDDDCDGTPDEPAEADLACTALVGRGVGLCSGAECHRLRCDAGWADCDGAIATGCETELATDGAHCGACGRACAAGAACVSGVCETPTVIAAGWGHTCAVMPSGAVACWGEGRFGQLGNGATDDATRPTLVAGLPPAIDVAAITDETCALLASDGSVWCWGRAAPGSPLSPMALPGSPTGLVEIEANGGHFCGLTTAGEVWCWGDNSRGQLGDGTTMARAMPVRANVPSGVVQVAPGAFGTCVRAGGEVWCWGVGSSGGLGNGGIADSLVPVRVSGIADATWVGYGPEVGCVVRVSGQLWCWGANRYNPLVGDGTYTDRLTPVRTGAFADAAEVFVGANSACVVRTPGTMSCWGANVGGAIGDGTSAERASPVAVSGMREATSVTMGSSHTCATLRDGAVSCWGANDRGQLADATRSGRPYPGRVIGLGTVEGGAGGAYHACALDELGGVYCAGGNAFGQLGAGRPPGGTSDVPLRIAGTSRAVAITSGAHHACALRVDGTVVCWGSNAYGQIGDGRTDHSSCPTHPSNGPAPTDCAIAPNVVTALSDVVQVAAGARSTCALRRDGTVACWGDSTALGDGGGTYPATPADVCRVSVFGTDGQTACSLAPVDVVGLSDVVEIAVGSFHACARRAGGSVVCWGTNSDGELGDGTRASRTSPVAAIGVIDAIAITVGTAHTCAIRRDHTVTCWGRGVATPATVSGLADVVRFDGGGEGVCVARAGGDASCFTPGTTVAIASLATGVVEVARDGYYDTFLPPTFPPIGGQLTCALDANGVLSCLGSNAQGQLADGTTTERTTLARWRLR